MSNYQTNPSRQPLTRGEVNALIQAYKFITQTPVPSLKSPANDKIIEELSQCQELLSQALYQHAGEFLGCWITMTNDYQPLVDGFSSLLRHASVSRISPAAPTAEDFAKHKAQAEADAIAAKENCCAGQDNANVIQVPFVRTTKKS